MGGAVQHGIQPVERPVRRKQRVQVPPPSTTSMDLDRLLGKRFDLLMADGQVLDVRLSAVNPERDLAVCHILVPGRRRSVQHAVLTDLLTGIRKGVLVESLKP